MAWNKTGNIKGNRGDKGDKGDPAPNQIAGSLAGVPTQLTLWMGTRAEYDAIDVKDQFTVYVIRPDGTDATLPVPPVVVPLPEQPEQLELVFQGTAAAFAFIGDKFYVGAGDWDDFKIFVFDARTGVQLAIIPIDHQPVHLMASEPRAKLYVADCTKPGTVSYIDTNTNTVMGTVTPLNNTLDYVDGGVVVANYLYLQSTNILVGPNDFRSGITTVNIDTDKVIKEDKSLQMPMYMVQSIGETNLLVNDYDNNELWLVDGRTGTKKQKIVGPNFVSAYVTKAGKAYCLGSKPGSTTGYWVINLSSGAVRDTGLESPNGTNTLTLVGNKFCYLIGTNDNVDDRIGVADATTFEILGSVPITGGYGTRLLGDDIRLYVNDDDGLSIYNLDKILARRQWMTATVERQQAMFPEITH